VITVCYGQDSPFYGGFEMKTYSTGEVAKICGLKSARVVARMFDRDQIGGELVQSRYQRQTTRRIPLRSLMEFMIEHDIPYDDFVDAQKWILCQTTQEFKKMLEKARKRSGVLSGFGGLVNGMLDVVRNLDPLTNLSGLSEDRRRIAIFEKMVEVMKQHVRVRCKIAKSKK